MSKRLEIFTFRLSQEERQTLLNLAELEDRSAGAWLRHQIRIAASQLRDDRTRLRHETVMEQSANIPPRIP